jgi:hypothetical protein
LKKEVKRQVAAVLIEQSGDDGDDDGKENVPMKIGDGDNHKMRQVSKKKSDLN